MDDDGYAPLIGCACMKHGPQVRVWCWQHNSNGMENVSSKFTFSLSSILLLFLFFHGAQLGRLEYFKYSVSGFL